MNKIKLAVVGATGVVGQSFVSVLEEMEEINLNFVEVVFFASSRSAGKTLKFSNDIYVIQELTEDSFVTEHFDYALFSAGSEVAKEFAPVAARNGCIVIDNSSAFRMDNDVPLVVPEVNPDDIQHNNGIIANPNCSTIQAVVVLKLLDDLFKIKRIVFSTYQAVSGAGSKGIHDFENGIKDYYLSYLHTEENLFSLKKSVPNYSLEKFPYPIFNNCLPHIDTFLENGYTKEEEKMINETRKILHNPNLPITATAVRVPVLNCHCESINIEFENSFELDDVVNILQNCPGIIVEDDVTNLKYAYPSDVCGSNSVFISRIRRDFSVENGLNLWVVADNIRKGAATNAIQILSLFLNKKLNKNNI